MTSFKKPTLITHPRYWGRRILQAWPVLVWLFLVWVFCMLQSEGTRLHSMTGMVIAAVDDIGPVETARIKTINVTPGQVVKAGDVVVEMDANPPNAKISNLKAIRPGKVSRVHHEVGDVAKEGSTIVRIVGEKPRYIQGYLPENHMAEIAVGDKVSVTHISDHSQPIAATVTALSPEVQDLPGNINPANAAPTRGRIVTLEINGESDLLPGETVHISPPNRKTCCLNFLRK